ncbi:MAG: hypothetical protein Q8R88_07555, partial [Desulfoprunum sp.]|nr:hypothetical protein [Desulfoprunum sp.]
AFEAFFSGMPIAADPGMAFLNGTLQLLDPSAPRGQRRLSTSSSAPWPMINSAQMKSIVSFAT